MKFSKIKPIRKASVWNRMLELFVRVPLEECKQLKLALFVIRTKLFQFLHIIVPHVLCQKVKALIYSDHELLKEIESLV